MLRMEREGRIPECLPIYNPWGVVYNFPREMEVWIREDIETVSDSRERSGADGRNRRLQGGLDGVNPLSGGKNNMKVRNHLLAGDNVELRETPNRGGLMEPRFLVFHYTSGKTAGGSVDWLCNPDAKASAHLVVARDGRVIQLAPFNVKTWHAGKSHWAGLSSLNSCSVGIEMDNAGQLTEVGTSYRAWFQKVYPENEVICACHKHGREPSFWHAYTEIQIDRAVQLACLLVGQYGLSDILGHDDIAPGRKKDPGPAFPLENIRARIFGRAEDEEQVYEVIARRLNIRSGPGVEYGIAAGPLAAGAKVRLLESRDRWSKVDIDDGTDLEGWVCSKYIKPLQVSIQDTQRTEN